MLSPFYLFSPEPVNILEKYLQSTLKHKLFDHISYTAEKQAEYPGTAAKVQDYFT